MNRRAFLVTVGSGSLLSGCLRLEAESGTGQEDTPTATTGEDDSTDNPPSTTDNNDSSDNTSTSSGNVELSVSESFDITMYHGWFDGTKIYTSGDSEVAALNTDEIRWQKGTGGRLNGGRAFTSKSGTVIFGFYPSDESTSNAAAQFRAYNSADGANRWQYRAPTDGVHIHCRGAVISQGVAALGSNRYGSGFEPDPLVTGVNAESGEVQWETYLGSAETEARYLSGIWVYDGLICVGLASNGVVLLDPSTGDIESRFPKLRTLTTGGAVEGERFFAAHESELTAYELEDGTSSWTGEIEGRSFIEPMIDSGLVIVGTGSGNVYAFDRSTGNPQWSGSVSGQVSAITASTDHIWVATESGALVGFDRAEGNVVHRSARDITGMVYGEARLVFGADETQMITTN